jgi:hypothetical protein
LANTKDVFSSEVPPDYFAWLKTSGALDKSDNKELKDAILKMAF